MDININMPSDYAFKKQQHLLYWGPKWNLYTFIIQISNTLLNQGISHCLYNIGHITKAIICLKFKQGDNSCSENRKFYQNLNLL